MTMPLNVARHPVAQLVGRARLAALRGSFAVQDLLMPAKASERALALWCTVPGTAGRRKDFRPSRGSVSALRTSTGLDVVTETWGEGPVVYLVHGWGGWRGQLGAFVSPLVDAGYQVVGFDAPGHGEAAPGALGAGKGHVMEMLAAFEAVVSAHGAAAGIVAHSLGCTVAALVARDTGCADRLVLIGPPADFVERTHEFAGLLGFSERTRGRLQRSMEDECGRPLADFDLAPLAASGQLPAPLIVHDQLDKETPYRVGADLAATWPQAELLTTLGLGHQRILMDADVVTAAVRHFATGTVRPPDAIAPTTLT